jgi:hypothetical protein
MSVNAEGGREAAQARGPRPDGEGTSGRSAWGRFLHRVPGGFGAFFGCLALYCAIIAVIPPLRLADTRRGAVRRGSAAWCGAWGAALHGDEEPRNPRPPRRVRGPGLAGLLRHPPRQGRGVLAERQGRRHLPGGGRGLTGRRRPGRRPRRLGSRHRGVAAARPAPRLGSGRHGRERARCQGVRVGGPERPSAGRRVSLNFAVFRAAFEEGARIGAGPVLRAWRRLLLFFSKWWQLEALYRSNVKYQPEWHPRFLCYADAGSPARISLACCGCGDRAGVPHIPEDTRGEVVLEMHERLVEERTELPTSTRTSRPRSRR